MYEHAYCNVADAAFVVLDGSLGACAQDPAYRTAADFDYWIPLQFDETGAVKQFEEFVDEYTLALA